MTGPHVNRSPYGPSSAPRACILLPAFGGGLDLLAVDASGPAGFAAAVGGELEALYVLPSRWGHGVGSHLLEGIGEVSHLWVLRDNTRARRWYERRGCAPSGRNDQRSANQRSATCALNFVAAHRKPARPRYERG